MSHAENIDPTPYEKFLRASLEEVKRKADALSKEYSTSGPLKKMQVKRELDLANQNIELLSQDLAKYEGGLQWLREPTKERDEKAEDLKPVPIEAITGAAKQAAQVPEAVAPATNQASAPVSKPPTPNQPAAPRVGTPIGEKKEDKAST